MYTSINYWYGWRYTGVPGLSGMMRVGDRVEWKDADGSHKFSVLVADMESVDVIDKWSNSAHPDRDDFLALTTLRNGVHVFVPGYSCFSYWDQWGLPPNRGKIDQSFAYEDGSVITMRDVALGDDRLRMVPGYISSADTVKCRTWLPER